jgi:DNA polymerase
MELVDPAVVVTLGRFALGHFLPGARISQVHGRPRRLGNRLFLPMLHPAAALHQASWRPQLEQDFRALRDALATEEAARVEQARPRESGPGRPAAQLSLFD